MATTIPQHSDLIPEARRLGWLRWEADVKCGHTTFTFPGYTRAGALRNATKFVFALADKAEPRG